MIGTYGIDQLTLKLISNWIDMSSGNFLVELDPYRKPEKVSKNFRQDWFDEEGVLKPEIKKSLQVLLKEKKYHWYADCDMSAFLGACKFAFNVGVPDIYYWKR